MSLNLYEIVEKIISVTISAHNKFVSANSKYSINRKGFGNFVTSVDKDIEQYLYCSLHEILPHSAFLGEESELKNGVGYMWIVDPIDGTTNFIYGYEYTISVALTFNGITLCGIVYVPTLQRVYYAIKDNGSFIYDLASQTRTQISKDKYIDEDGVALFGLPYDRSKAHTIFGIAEKIFEHSSDVKRMGPASLDICKVAEGKAKVYVEFDLKPWDIAAAELVLKESGGDCIVKDESLFIFYKYPDGILIGDL